MGCYLRCAAYSNIEILNLTESWSSTCIDKELLPSIICTYEDRSAVDGRCRIRSGREKEKRSMNVVRREPFSIILIGSCPKKYTRWEQARCRGSTLELL